MKKLMIFVFILALFMLASCAGMRKDTLESDMDAAAEVGASANSYDVNTTPSLTADYLLGIDDFGEGSWAVQRFNISNLAALYWANPAFTGDPTITDTTPSLTLDDSAGADGFIAQNANDADDGVITIGVDDSNGDDQTYITLDGVNKRIQVHKPLYGLGGWTGDLSVSGVINGLLKPVGVLVPSGVQDGGDDQAIMTDGGIDIGASALVGMTVYNVTDESSCTITANAATTITCTLAGGTGNDWDDGDVWQVGPGPSQSGSMFYVGAAGTIRHPATLGYVAGYYVNVAGVVTVDMPAAMVFQGNVGGAFVATLGAAGDCIDSPATQGSYYIIHNKSATEGIGMGYVNTWVDGGAS